MTVGIVLYCVFYGGLVLVGKIGVWKHFRKKQRKNNSLISLNDITLIVPFRNEIHRIQPLLESISTSDELPKTILFVDDHSDDETEKHIREQLEKIPYQLLLSKENGKKGALKTGIENATTSYVLTMDADVEFPATYFSNLKKLPCLDMHILPVKMVSRGWKKLFELDVYMVNGLNLLADGFKRPIVASGANLLFKRSVYNEVSSYPTHANILSGDDQFLLSDFNKNNKTIGLQTNSDFAVTTPVPHSLTELISQRLRWISKTPKVKDNFAFNIGMVQAVLMLLFVALSLLCIVNANWLGVGVVYFTKTICDSALVQPYFSEIRKQKLLGCIPIYEILLPLYMLLLFVLLLFFQPKWKGRGVVRG